MQWALDARCNQNDEDNCSFVPSLLGTQSSYGERSEDLSTHLVAAATQIARDMGVALPSKLKEMAEQFAHEK